MMSKEFSVLVDFYDNSAVERFKVSAILGSDYMFIYSQIPCSLSTTMSLVSF